MGTRPKHTATKHQTTREEGSINTGAKAVFRRTWYDIMTKARKEEGKNNHDRTNRGEIKTEDMEKEETGQSRMEEGMEFEMEGNREEVLQSNITWVTTEGDIIDLNKPRTETSMILHKHPTDQPLPS